MRKASICRGVLLAMVASGLAAAADGQSYKSAGGLTVYLGVLPAALIQGEAREHVAEAHGDVPRGPHAYHVVVAVFDARTGKRIEDATISARVAPRRLTAVTRGLEPMAIAGTVTYGNYFTMAGDDPYEITVTVTRTKTAEPVAVSFSYEHGTK